MLDRRSIAVLVLSAACSSVPERERVAKAQQEDEAAASSVEIPEETLEALEALGYFPRARTDNPDERGVTTHAGVASPGLNLYSSRSRASALLTDLGGRVLHRWHIDPDETQRLSWMHVEPLPDGHLLIITKDHYLTKRDWDSNLVWRRGLRAHHDLAVDASDRIFVLVREDSEIEREGRELPVLADAVAVLTPDGEVERTVDLLPLFRDEIPENRIRRIRTRYDAGERDSLVRPGGIADVLHTNSIDLLHRDIPGVAPAGSVLLSFRALSRIAIVSPALDEVLWIWGRGELDGQHDATQLSNGNVLLFDNGLQRGERSRVLEVDPTSGEIVWRYDPPELFTRLRGGAQELPNGNILITESDRGYAREVTRQGETVWEFWNPDVEGRGDDAERAVIYRLNRFPEAFFAPLLSG